MQEVYCILPFNNFIVQREVKKTYSKIFQSGVPQPELHFLIRRQCLALYQLDQPCLIPPGLMFNDLAICDPRPGHTCIMDGFSCWRELHPRACMCPVRGESHSDAITVNDHFFDGMLQIGKGWEELTHESLYAFGLRKDLHR